MQEAQFYGVLEEILSSHWILAFAKTPNATCIVAPLRTNFSSMRNCYSEMVV